MDEKYNTALEEARKLYNDSASNPGRREWLAKIFPELVEQKPKMTPKWLYRLEFKDSSCGLWYDGSGKWCFESGIGSIGGCKTKTLPMDYDARYKQDGRNWFSSCSRKEDLMHWYSLEDAKELISKGFVFTRYLATEYHEYDQQTVFIKETALYREEIDIFELFGQKPDEWTGYNGIVIDKTEYPELTDAEFAILRGFVRITGLSHFPITIIKETAQNFRGRISLPSALFPELKWKDEPIEVELLIIRK